MIKHKVTETLIHLSKYFFDVLTPVTVSKISEEITLDEVKVK